jgi:hypothetical protein
MGPLALGDDPAANFLDPLLAFLRSVHAEHKVLHCEYEDGSLAASTFGDNGL